MKTLGIAVLLAAVLRPAPGYADIDFRLGLALGNAASVSLTEGDSLNLLVNVTNDSGAPITPLFFTQTIFAPIQPDTSDYGFASVVPGTETCGFAGNHRMLANGAACSFEITVYTDDLPSPEVDFDSGASLTQISLTYQTQGGAEVTNIESITATVNDPAPVPEPAYSMLLGLALTACALFRRRLTPGRKRSP